MAKTKSTAIRMPQAFGRRVKDWWKKRRQSRVRLHRSFRHTRRRDYIRSLELPGYIAFSAEVFKTLLTNKAVFIRLVVLYALLIVIFGGLSGQNIYGQVSQAVGDESLSFAAMVGQASLAALVELGTAGSTASETGRIYLGLIVIMVWLTVVWLLREIGAGHKPNMRDGLYNSGSPLIATLILILVMLIQLLPLGLLAVVYGGLVQAGLAGEGLGAMLFFAIVALTAALCLYWVTSTFIALVIVTLPGMYPLRALKVAGDIVIGRRLRITYRLLWLIAMLTVIGAVIMTPTILVEQWLVSLADWVTLIPILPVVSAVTGSMLVVVAASYTYLLYRKVVAHDAETSR